LASLFGTQCITAENNLVTLKEWTKAMVTATHTKKQIGPKVDLVLFSLGTFVWDCYTW